jgi:adenylosuccinate synthase
VTSSHIHPAFAFASFGIPMQKLGEVYGVCKIYETYVGNATELIYSSDEDAEKIREAGDEYGETTGRARDIGYLDVQQLIDALNHNGATTLYINKVDVLEDVKIFKLIDIDGQIKQFDTLDDMKECIIDSLMLYTELYREKIIFSGKKDGSDIA